MGPAEANQGSARWGRGNAAGPSGINRGGVALGAPGWSRLAQALGAVPRGPETSRPPAPPRVLPAGLRGPGARGRDRLSASPPPDPAPSRHPEKPGLSPRRPDAHPPGLGAGLLLNFPPLAAPEPQAVEGAGSGSPDATAGRCSNC
ncbi:uncharacterized protein WM277_015766 isoform 2-T2 [Molossus nigricans]